MSMVANLVKAMGVEMVAALQNVMSKMFCVVNFNPFLTVNTDPVL